MYAGIQRIRATSRKRTRKEARKVRRPGMPSRVIVEWPYEVGAAYESSARPRRRLCDERPAEHAGPEEETRGARHPARLRFADHVAQLGVETDAGDKVAAAHRANERTRFVHRQAREGRAELAPDPVATQILFNVGDVKRRNERAVIADVGADAAE